MIEVRAVTSSVGAMISGVDLRAPLSGKDQRAIEDALLEHGVVFFRDQDITPDQQVEFAKQFGTISVPPMAPAGSPRAELMVLDQVSPKDEGADNWHSDNTFMSEPPQGSILKAVELPSVGGDTCFASAAAAYEALSSPMQRLVDELHAVHDITKPMRRAIAAGIFDEKKLAALQVEWPPVTHPVARTHPITGRKALFVSRRFTVRVADMAPDEGEALLLELFDYAERPEHIYHHHWSKNQLLLWDNRCTVHLACGGVPDSQIRTMQRTTVRGEMPV